MPAAEETESENAAQESARECLPRRLLAFDQPDAPRCRIGDRESARGERSWISGEREIGRHRSDAHFPNLGHLSEIDDANASVARIGEVDDFAVSFNVRREWRGVQLARDDERRCRDLLQEAI